VLRSPRAAAGTHTAVIEPVITGFLGQHTGAAVVANVLRIWARIRPVAFGGFQHPTSFITRLILGITTVHLAIGIFVHGYWLATANQRVLRFYFDYAGTLVLLLFAALQTFFRFLHTGSLRPTSRSSWRGRTSCSLQSALSSVRFSSTPWLSIVR